MNKYNPQNLSVNLKTLIRILGCTNSDIAVYAKCSASNISRIRSGSRKLDMNSKTIKNLVQGIYEYSFTHNSLEKLCILISCHNKVSEDKFRTDLIKWLYSKNNEVYEFSEELVIQKRLRFRFFGEKLTAIMEMLGISNAKLGKAVNVDPSYISRLRNGVRVPKRNSTLTEDIVYYLLEKVMEQNKTRQLSRMINIPHASFNNESYIKNTFYNWLNDIDNKTGETEVEKFLENIDRFSIANMKELPDISTIIDPSLMTEQQNEYIGTQGLRRATIRFLANVIVKNAKEIWLYSDQDISWITEDKSFLIIWMTLLGTCVRKRMKIKIIHNINRDPDEMIKGLESWIPLYMSGMIEPYYSKRITDERFSHSLFICPDVVCAEASHVRGSEKTGVYRYHEDKMHLEIFMNQFENLLSTCEPLMKIYTQTDLAKYIFYTDNAFNKGSIVTMLNSLSIAFLPKRTLDSMLLRVSITDEEKEKIYSFYLSRVNMYRKAIKHENVSDIIPLPDIHDVEEGKISLNLENIRSGLRIPYTLDDYKSHVEKVLSVMKSDSTYSLVSLPETPFANVQIIINGDIVTVVKSNTPQIAFVISNPQMSRAFKEYASRLHDKYYQEREDIEKKLSEYLV